MTTRSASILTGRTSPAHRHRPSGQLLAAVRTPPGTYFDPAKSINLPQSRSPDRDTPIRQPNKPKNNQLAAFAAQLLSRFRLYPGPSGARNLDRFAPTRN
ncbi:MAG: hypothetical protein WA988_13125 [Candidatus Nanopelagicales bacterium]